jgi:hypothetical protein
MGIFPFVECEEKVMSGFKISWYITVQTFCKNTPWALGLNSRKGERM